MNKNNELSIELFNLLDTYKYTFDLVEKAFKLLEKGADVNYKQIEYPYETSLYRCLSSGKSEYKLSMVELLIENGADVNLAADIFSPLSQAVMKNDIEIMQLLLKNGANDFSYSLKCAIEQDEIEMVQLLINYGAQCNYFEEYNCSFLEFCNEPFRLKKEDCHYEKSPGLAMAELLISWGANPNGVENGTSSPISEAIRHNFIELVNLLLQNGAAFTDQLIFYCNTLEMTSFLLEKNMFFNKFCKNHIGQNVLIYNAMQSNYELVHYWINSGIDLYDFDQQGFTAFHYLIMKENRDVFEHFLPYFDIKICNTIKPILDLINHKEMKAQIEQMLIA
ncbi:ankyrin repeat domain-containing protein [Flavobacterium sp. J27]|uniref:ankyrin repeat domain-containing protein n=1 Tax=Flavobacterium sp. J27 TaxID=2060419 RepID=UPI00103068CB|nr:ankyrin repeat domain-containing protein [Flavobacterium sp. J27]